MFSKKDLYGQTAIENEHVDNNVAVRDMLVGRGIFLNKFLQMKILRQGYFSKEKRFNTFFINLIYNKGEGGIY